MTTPTMQIQPGTIESIPPSEWPWVWILIIVLVVICATVIISWTTQRSIRAMAAAARQMVSDARSFDDGKRKVAGLSAMGRGEVAWEPGAFKINLRSRLAGDAGSVQAAERNSDRLVQQLFALGIGEAEIEQSEPEVDDRGMCHVDMAISLLKDAEGRSTKVLEAAMSCGFGEVREVGREEISFEDAAEMAGRAAIEDAMGNTSVLLDHLKIEKAGLKVVSARIHSEPDNGKIVRVAEVIWDGDR